MMRTGDRDTITPALAGAAELLRQHGRQAKKSWGQNFLHDPRVVARIVEAAAIQPTDVVVEIGAGLGALTGALAARAARVLAIERDRELASLLRQAFAGAASVAIVEANALTFDFAAVGSAERLVVVGNLPYNIASPLLFRLLEARAHLRSATVMLQRELAQRLVAGPGSRRYGVPSVLLQQHADLQTCLQVGRGAFVPAPRVDSTVIRLDFRTVPRAPADDAALRLTVRTAFGMRRKTLLRALSAAFPEHAVAAALAECGIDPRARAETLTVAQFAALAQALPAPAPGSAASAADTLGPALDLADDAAD